MDKKLWARAVDFHGHECPGLAIGFRACELAMEKLSLDFSRDEDIVCVTENDACGVDAIQVLLGCSLGKGNLIYRDRGKQAYSFFNRNTGEKIRIVCKQIKGKMERKDRQAYILGAAADEIFTIGQPNYKLPPRAKIFDTLICESCGEGAAEHKIRLCQGKKLCLDCFEDYTRGF